MFVQTLSQYELGWYVPKDVDNDDNVQTPPPQPDSIWTTIGKVILAVLQFFKDLISAPFNCCYQRTTQPPTSPPAKTTHNIQPIPTPDPQPKSPPIALTKTIFEQALIPDLEKIVTDYLALSDLFDLTQHPTLQFKCTEAFYAFQNALKYIPSSNFIMPIAYKEFAESPVFEGEKLSDEEQLKRLPQALEAIGKLRPMDVNTEIVYRDGMLTKATTLLIHTLQTNKNDKNRLAIVKALLVKGADPTQKGCYYVDISPINIAKAAQTEKNSSENDELVKLLEASIAAKAPPAPV